MRPDLIYAAGRVLGVVSRPAALFLANNLIAAGAAQQLALGFLVSSLGLVGVAADPHRRFYARQFSREIGAHPITRQTYLWSVAILMVVGMALCLTLVARFGNSWILAWATSAYFVSEKLVDEVLRYRLFARDFARWGFASCARALLQLLLFAALILSYGQEVSAWLVVVAFMAGNLVVFGLPLLPDFARSLKLRYLPLFFRLLWRASRSLFLNRRLWMMALLTAGVGYLDRLVALVVDRTSLPLFVLMVMCFSVVQMAVDFFYVSRHRREFLEQKISVRQVFAKGGVQVSLAGGIVVALAAAIVVMLTARNADEFPIFYLVAIAVVQISTALALVLREILYWGQDLRRVFLVELIFWTSFTLVAAISTLAKIPIGVLLTLVIGCLILRLGLYFGFAAHVRRHITPTPPAAPGGVE